MSDTARDQGKPFGTVYFGAILAVIGLVLTVASPVSIGPVLAIVGAMLVCTGLVLRAMPGRD